MTVQGKSTAQRRVWTSWVGAILAATGIIVVVWVCASSWDALVHANPAYPVLLALTALGCAVALWASMRWRVRRGGWRSVLRVVLLVLGAAWIAAIGWLRPYPALEPALSAMHADTSVQVTETATRIVLAPSVSDDSIGVFFQPGALVDARAYAAVLRPLAERGHTVVIAKQPLGIAFLAVGALEDARSALPGIHRWVAGGHSLGGTVAAIEAEREQHAATSPVVGLLLYASYPATDISTTLSIAVESVSGTRDGLATPSKIEASRADLPPSARFTVISGASHAQFGSYGPQAGDNTPTISDSEARSLISDATVRFVDGLNR
ncbi:alpha/beta hydrolase [Agromyces humatus]|uniref:Alpha/beta hydrolase fold-5 domain-containing protein n=1 Tax=Agromyces humatus TaxID=279573 RepID=A0ABN2KM52_9MICO|nr:alpha/beta hydrolase [Agromyces humatus]